jgi:ATP-dependent Zn protease
MDPTARRYRREHREFLATNRPDVYAALLRSGRLDSYLNSVGETASERLEHVMSQHLADKELQKLPHLERVRQLQNRHQEAEEIIRNDLILQPVED